MDPYNGATTEQQIELFKKIRNLPWNTPISPRH